MKRHPVVILFALVAFVTLAALQLHASPAGAASAAAVAVAAVPDAGVCAAPDRPATPDPAALEDNGLTPMAGGGCNCPKTTPVCCHNCNGTFAYCARSFAFCPECPAP